MKSSRTIHDNRQRVVEVAKKIISRKGFSAVGLNEILTAAGIPKGSFYYYFASKEEFGTLMLEDYFTRYLETMEELLSAGEDPAQAMMNYWQSWTATDERFIRTDAPGAGARYHPYCATSGRTA